MFCWTLKLKEVLNKQILSASVLLINQNRILKRHDLDNTDFKVQSIAIANRLYIDLIQQYINGARWFQGQVGPI